MASYCPSAPTASRTSATRTRKLCRCIKSKQYYLARQLLEQDIFCLGDTGVNAADYLLYCYYGALVCIAVKDFDPAFRQLELAMTMPTSVPDAVILACWHRYQLLYALRTGTLYRPAADHAARTAHFA